MKQITLTESLAELTEVTLKKNGKDIQETMTRFHQATLHILNSGSIQYKDVPHFKKVSKARKALFDFAMNKEILLEDGQFRELWGTEDSQGVLQRFSGWLSNEFSDEYIECWDTAKEVSVKQIKKERAA